MDVGNDAVRRYHRISTGELCFDESQRYAPSGDTAGGTWSRSVVWFDVYDREYVTVMVTAYVVAVPYRVMRDGEHPVPVRFDAARDGHLPVQLHSSAGEHVELSIEAVQRRVVHRDRDLPLVTADAERAFETQPAGFWDREPSSWDEARRWCRDYVSGVQFEDTTSTVAGPLLSELG